MIYRVQDGRRISLEEDRRSAVPSHGRGRGPYLCLCCRTPMLCPCPCTCPCPCPCPYRHPCLCHRGSPACRGGWCYPSLDRRGQSLLVLLGGRRSRWTLCTEDGSSLSLVHAFMGVSMTSWMVGRSKDESRDVELVPVRRSRSLPSDTAVAHSTRSIRNEAPSRTQGSLSIRRGRR